MDNIKAIEIAERIRTRQISAVEVTQYFIDRIKKLNSSLNAFVTVCDSEAIKQAKEIDEKIKNGSLVGSLAGLPVAIKDNICVQGMKTTCSSKILENYVSPYNATIIEKLYSADAVIVGKTNMDEFAMGSSTENSAFFSTRNPYNTDCIPGGSSGGSAAAVSAGLAPLALGSDTGGSIRQPAAMCGVVGLKPTYGRVSRYGLIAFASSLDQIGVFANCVEDCALLLGVIAGYDIRDSTSVNLPVSDYLKSIKSDIKCTQEVSAIKVGLPKEYFIKGLDKEIADAIMKAAKQLESLGCKIEEISLPHTEYAVAVYYIVAPSEASANLARYDAVKYGFRADEGMGRAVEGGVAGDSELIRMYKFSRGNGFGPEVKRRIMLGTYALSSGYYDAYYLKAQKVRTLIERDFETAFKCVDVILTPTTPSVAFKIGEKVNDPLQMYLSDIFTIPCNLAGLPGISIPCGFSNREGNNRLPIGMQLIGKPFDEETILKVAWNYEQSREG